MQTRRNFGRKIAEAHESRPQSAEKVSTSSLTSHLHIAFFLPELTVGGAERVFLTLAGELARRGHKVELLLARKSGALLADVPENVQVIALTNCGPQAPAWRLGLHSLIGLVWRLRKRPPDALFSTLTGANLVAILARHISRSSTRLFIREAATLTNVRSRARLGLMHHLYPRADGIIALTPFMKREMTEKLKLAGRNLRVIGNPVDEQRILRLSREEPLDKARSYQPYIVAVGRLSPPKDLMTLISALSGLHEAAQPIDLVVVGNGPLKDSLQTHARDIGLERHVHFVGLQANPYAWMAAAEIFVLSSRWEGHPNALLEAIALGKPVVVTEYDESIRSLLDGNPNATIVPVGDDQAMAKAIEQQLAARNSEAASPVITTLDDAVDAYIELATGAGQSSRKTDAT